MSLRDDYYTSVIPIIIGDHDDEEVIFASSMSGGADYVDGLPRRLTLVRKFADGREEIWGVYHYVGKPERLREAHPPQDHDPA